MRACAQRGCGGGGGARGGRWCVLSRVCVCCNVHSQINSGQHGTNLGGRPGASRHFVSVGRHSSCLGNQGSPCARLRHQHRERHHLRRPLCQHRYGCRTGFPREAAEGPGPPGAVRRCCAVKTAAEGLSARAVGCAKSASMALYPLLGKFVEARFCLCWARTLACRRRRLLASLGRRFGERYSSA